MIPISYFLIPYAIILLGFLFFTIVDLYHLIWFGRATGFVGFFVTFLFLAGAVIIINASYNYIITIDWNHLINVIPSFGPPSFD